MFGALRPKPDARMLRQRRGAAGRGAEPLRPRRGHAGAPQGGALARHAHGLDAALRRRALSRRLARTRSTPASNVAPTARSRLSEAALPLCQNRRAPAPDTPPMTPSSDLPAGAIRRLRGRRGRRRTPLPRRGDRSRQPRRRLPPAPPARKRPEPGERRVQILQTLATMLEQPGAERITTAALAAKLDVSEAALYRHFASKAQMFEGLIEFIEQSVFTLVNQIVERDTDAARPGAEGARRAAAVRREEPGHDAGDGRRRAGVRERAPARRA